MRTYERHELTEAMVAKVEIPDEMAIYREMLETLPDEPDMFSARKIEEVERRKRVEEREAMRPIEPAPVALTRPIQGINNRTGREVFEIMSDRIEEYFLHGPEGLI